MNFPDGLFPAEWQALAWVPFGAFLLWAAWTAPWRRLGDSAQSNVWLGYGFSEAWLTGRW